MRIGKLVIQIPCFNEQETIGITIESLPKSLPSVDQIEVLIIDDGSSDDTVGVARHHGAHHIVSIPSNRGLANAFSRGLEESLRMGADVIVNTDADNQYCADDIALLIVPIIEGRADMTVGARPIGNMEHFSPLKKILQRLGSGVVRWASKTSVDDAPSGFRALSRKMAQQINVFSEYSYTLETIIQAGQKGLSVVSIPIRTNEPTRPSRLFKSNRTYVRRSAGTILRIFVTYRPFRFFAFVGFVPFICGAVIGVRFLVLLFAEQGQGHVQSLILASMLISMGFLIIMTGLVADLISVNRKLLEKVSSRMWLLEDRLAGRIADEEEDARNDDEVTTRLLKKVLQEEAQSRQSTSA